MNRLITHIANKLEEKGEIMDHFDVPRNEQIEYIMLTTFEVVKEECQNCFYCKNYRRFSIGSLFKIKPHIQDDCFHFSLDVNKVLKKEYYHILVTVSECTMGKYILDKHLSSKTTKNIIYESIRLSESLKDFRIINNCEET